MANVLEKDDVLVKSGAHFGYSRSTRHPKMSPFIFTAKNGVEIFDLEKIKLKLEVAKEFVKSLGKDKKIIIFVATKKEAKEAGENIAKRLNMPYVTERWLGGTLTNFKEIKKRIDYLAELKNYKTTGVLEKYTKKERLMIEKKISALEKYLSGLENFKDMPAALIVVDSNEEKIAIAEAREIGIPVVAIMNSDCDPDDVDYPIPANDSSLASINYLLEELTSAYDNSGTN